MASNSPHFTFMTLVAEVGFVAVLSIVADASPQAETLVLTIICGLWLAFLVNQGPKLISMFTPRQ